MKTKFGFIRLFGCGMLIGFAPHVFAQSWTYASNTLTEDVTDGSTAWVLKTSGSSTALTVTGVSTTGASTVLDLTTINGGTLVKIADDSLKGKTSITEVILPETVTAIGVNGFRACTGLTKVTLPQGLTSLGSCAFYGDSKLKTLVPFLPAATVMSGTDNFHECTALTGTCTIATLGTTAIGTAAFYGPKLTEIDLSKSGVKSIGQNAFRQATQLKKLYLPATLTTLGANPFYDASSCTAFFKSFPTSCDAAAFEISGDYRLRVVITPNDTDWLEYCENAGANFIAAESWTTTIKEKYTYGDESAYTPYGVFKMGSKSKWIFIAVSNEVGTRLSVRTSPEGADLLATVDPACVPKEDIALPYVSTVPEIVKADDRCMQATGYTLFKENAQRELVEVETRTGVTTATIPVGTPGGVYTLQWNFEPVGYKLSVESFNSSWGSVTLPEPDVEGGYYAAGSSVAVTLDDVKGNFRHWLGGVTPETEWSATATVVMDAPKALRPVFCWEYDSSAATLSNGDWTLNTSGSAGALSIKSVKTSGSYGVVDFFEIANATLVGLAEGAFNGNAKVTEIDFSKSALASLGKNSLRKCSSLKKIFLPPTVTTLGADPFYDTSCTIFFRSFPTSCSANAFEYNGDYYLRVVVSESDANWLNYCTNAANFVAVADWTSTISNKYTYADKSTYTPYGVFKMGSASRWTFIATMKDVGSKMTVRTSPEDPDLLAAVDPACEVGEDVILPYVSTVPEIVKNDVWCRRATGYTLFKQNDQRELVEVETKTGVTTATIPAGEDGVYLLQWNFEPVGYKLAVAATNPDWGTVTLPDPDVEGEYYAAGSSVAVTMDDKQGYFRYWFGGVTPETERSAAATVVMDGPKTLHPIFCWVYDSSAATLSNGDWTLNTSGSAAALTTLGVKTTGSFGFLDFREIANATLVAISTTATPTFSGVKAVRDVRLPDTVTTVAKFAFRTSGLTNIVLSSNLKTIGEAAFYSCSSLQTMTPLLPSTLTSLGVDTFSSGAQIRGDLRLSNKNLTTAGNFSGCKLTSVDLSGSSIKSTAQNCFRGMPSLTNVVLDADFTTLGSCTFYNSTAGLKCLKFLGGPLTSVGSDAFAGNDGNSKWTDLKCRICVPKGIGWEAYVASNCLPVALTDAEKETFVQRFPGEKVPKEKIKLPTATAYQYLCYYPLGKGMRLIFR